jgi:hypothetical protein
MGDRMKAIRLAIVIALLCGGPMVDACSCVPRRPVAESFANAHHVFLGTVEQIDDRRTGLHGVWLRVRAFFGKEPYFSDTEAVGFKVTFRAKTIWKGPAERNVTVFTGRGGGDCGYRFEVGKTYLVYTRCDGFCYTGICMRTTKFPEKDLEILSKLPTIAIND